MRTVTHTLALSTLLIAATTFGQAPPVAPQSAPATITSTSTLVIVPTLVRSASGELIHGLKPSDFRLTDNGIEQKISIEDIERQPLAVVVLMQTGGTAPRQFQNYRNTGTMLSYMMGSSAHRVAAVTFDSRPEDQWDFTANIDDLDDAFTKPEDGDHGAAVVDAVDYAITLLREQPPQFRRIILLLSQPQDDGSKAHAEDVVRRLGESNTTIYSVTFSPEKTWLRDQFTKPRHEQPPYQLNPAGGPAVMHTFDIGTPLFTALRAMRTDTAAEVATLSGGEHVCFDNKAELERELGEIANHIPARYILSFRPSSKQPGFHSLSVRVVNQMEPLDVAARSSYWSTAPTAAGATAKSPADQK
jgi:VWFA-related protein